MQSEKAILMGKRTCAPVVQFEAVFVNSTLKQSNNAHQAGNSQTVTVLL